jgi:hypothetical protein
MSKVEDKNKISKEKVSKFFSNIKLKKNEGDDWEGHSDGEDEQEVANKIKQEKTNKKPQGLKDLFTGDSANTTTKKPATTTNKQQNYKQGGGYQKNYNKDYKGGERKEGAPQFTNKNKKFSEKDQGNYQAQPQSQTQSKKQDLEKPQFSGKVQATNQGTGLADKKQVTVVEEKKEEVEIEKPNFVIPTEGHFVDIDKNSDVSSNLNI